MQNGSGIGSQVLDLTGNNLALTTGGILASGNAGATIQSGTLSTLAGELIVTANNNLNIDASIVDSGTGTSFTKAGTGTVTLTGTNTYSGPTAIVQGTLVVSADANLGTASTIELGGGTLQAAADFSSTKGIAPGAGFAGAIDTAGHHDVTFGGPNTGTVTKTGDGTLTLTNAATGSTYVSAGTLALPHATTGNATLQGGTLVAAGTLTSLSTDGTPSILDIGGPVRSTLSIGSAPALNGLTIDFKMGGAAHDILYFTGNATFPTAPDSLNFEFQNLGGVTTGVNYLLISLPFLALAPSASIFSFAPIWRRPVGRVRSNPRRSVFPSALPPCLGCQET